MIPKLEECARALYAEDWSIEEWNGEPQSTKDRFQVRVCAVIRCLMEPSEAMIEAGYERHDFDDHLSDEADAFNKRNCGYVFRAMLQSALEEK